MVTKQRGPFPLTGVTNRDTTKYLGRYCLSPSTGTFATSLPQNGVLLIDIATGQQKRIGPHPTPARVEDSHLRVHFGGPSGTVLNAVVFTPHKRQLVTAAKGSSDVCFWSASSATAVASITQPEASDVLHVLLSESDRLVAVTSKKNDQRTQVHVWRLPRS